MSEDPPARPNSICFAPRSAVAAEQERAFSEMMDLVAARHPFYRRVLDEAGLSRADFASLADLSKLPVTTKRDFMAAPEAFELERDGLPDEMQIVWDVMYTTGSTSGRPTLFVSTTYDFYNILTLNRAMLALRGVTERDVIANLFPLTRHPHGAFIRTMHAAAVMNIPVVACLPGNPSPYFHHANSVERVVDIVARHRATILWGVPTFVRRVLEAAAAAGADFSAVRMVFVTGEALAEEGRAELCQRLVGLGASDPVISGSYGASEMQGGMVECRPGAGFHNPAPDQFYLEVVDPETHAPLADGAEGLLLLTHLKRRGTVLLRYALGDVTAISRERCPHCGATTDRLIVPPRRVDSLVKIKGMLVNPEVAAQPLAAEPAIEGFQLVARKSDPTDPMSPDELIVRAAAADGGNEALRQRIITAVKTSIGVTPTVEFVGRDALGDTLEGWKRKIFVDERLKRP